MRLRLTSLIVFTAMTASGCASWFAKRPVAEPAAPVAAAPVEPDLPLRPEMVTLPPLTEILSPNHNARPAGTAITAIVLHHTASAANAVGIARFFQRRDAQVSAHYVVDRDGTIVRCVPDARRAWHAGPSAFMGVPNVNNYSLGIEICNRGDGIEPYPPMQVAAVSRLVAQLARLHRIPLWRVTRHKDVIVPRGAKIDPSENFDFVGVVADAQALLDGRPVTTAAVKGDDEL